MGLKFSNLYLTVHNRRLKTTHRHFNHRYLVHCLYIMTSEWSRFETDHQNLLSSLDSPVKDHTWHRWKLDQSKRGKYYYWQRISLIVHPSNQKEVFGGYLVRTYNIRHVQKTMRITTASESFQSDPPKQMSENQLHRQEIPHRLAGFCDRRAWETFECPTGPMLIAREHNWLILV